MKTRLLILALIFLEGMAIGQTTKIRGKVYDLETKEPVPFVSITITGQTKGTITNFDGEYFLETKIKFDSLTFSCIGYKTVKHKANYGSYQELTYNWKPKSLPWKKLL
ncbi:MAG: carboxypeptidase-like regulatory domain-containing protein [Bacteroidales bacterium]|nr:carboxypeptidase-like regulatory domain-containing protein [Bacteroidales bacterium]